MHNRSVTGRMLHPCFSVNYFRPTRMKLTSFGLKALWRNALGGPPNAPLKQGCLRRAKSSHPAPARTKSPLHQFVRLYKPRRKAGCAANLSQLKFKYDPLAPLSQSTSTWLDPDALTVTGTDTVAKVE